MNRSRSLLIVGMGLMTAVATALAGSGPQPITAQEAALNGGATHKQVIKWSDFATITGTNGATYTNSDFVVGAKQGVELVYMKLKTAFEYTTTNGLSSITLIAGDGTDTDLFLDSTEVCVHGTEVFAKYGRLGGVAITSASTNFVVSTTAAAGGTLTTNAVTYVSAVGTTGAASDVGRKLYTSADTVDLIFTPTGTAWSLSQCNVGEVWLYWKIIDANR